MQLAKAYAAALVTFLVLDAIWLSVIAFDIFQREAGEILRPEPNLMAAGAFYVIYMFGLAVLVIGPALREQSPQMAVWRGAVLGLTAYATFDLTSLAVIRGWTITAAVIDIIWGVAGTTSAAIVGYLAASRGSDLNVGTVPQSPRAGDP